MSLTRVTCDLIKGSPIGIFDYLGSTVSTNTTIAENIALLGQYQYPITINTGVTLTINGPFTAGVFKVFNCVGTGKVVFNPDTTSVGYPEWWGAVAGDNTVDSSVAINACITALPQTILQAGNYYINSRIVMQVQGRALLGIGYMYAGNPGSAAVPATRLVIQNGTSIGILIGYDDNPGSGSNDYENYSFGATVKNVTITRAVPPVAPASFTPPTLPMPANLPVGIQITYAGTAELVNVDVWDSIVGIFMCATVGCHLTKCRSNRATAASSGFDYFNAYYLDGFVSSFATAGQNASTYLTDCSAQCRVEALSSVDRSQAYVLNGGLNDLFLFRPEAINFYTGIAVIGSQGTVKAKSDVDCHIIGAIIDVYRGNGIKITNVSDYGAISIMDGYFAPLTGMTGADFPGILIADCTGAISFVNNQVIGWQCLTSIAFLIDDSSGLLFKNNMYVGCSKKAVCTNVKNSRFEDIYSNVNEGVVSAITLINSTRNYVAPTVKAGVPNLYVAVVEMDVASSYTEVNCSGIDPTSIQSGGAKLRYNSVNVTTAGVFGTTSLASGIMN